MSCETLETQIDNILYVTTQWPATKQMLMKLKLINVFGDSIFEIAQGLTTKATGDKRTEEQIKALRSGITNLFTKSSPEAIVSLVKEVLACGATKREGVRITDKSFDEIYNDAGLPEAYKACVFVIKTNYSDFFKGQKAGEILAQVEEHL